MPMSRLLLPLLLPPSIPCHPPPPSPRSYGSTACEATPFALTSPSMRVFRCPVLCCSTRKGSGKTKSLLIGINYTGQQGQLNGCHNDVGMMKRYITTHVRKKGQGWSTAVRFRSLIGV